MEVSGDVGLVQGVLNIGDSLSVASPALDFTIRVVEGVLSEEVSQGSGDGEVAELSTVGCVL